MLEKHQQTVFTLRDEPSSAALNKPLPCRPPPDPLQRCLFFLSGPERKLNLPVSAASMARPSGRKKEKLGRYDTLSAHLGSLRSGYLAAQAQQLRRVATENFLLFFI
jgi:hypothetical protein